MNNRDIGAKKECLAIDYLKANGISILTSNYRCKIGEIDIIGYDKDTLVFFEVKYRATPNKGYASEAVGIQKRRKICRVSDYYRMVNNIGEYNACRFDVIAIDANRIDWIKNAFDYILR